MGYKPKKVFDAFIDKAKKDYPEKHKKTMFVPLTDKNAKLGMRVIDRSQNNRKGVIIESPGVIASHENSAIFYTFDGPYITIKWDDNQDCKEERILREGERAIARIFYIHFVPLATHKKKRLDSLVDNLKNLGS